MTHLLRSLKTLVAHLQEALANSFEFLADSPAMADADVDAFDGALGMAVRANLSGFSPRY